MPSCKLILSQLSDGQKPRFYAGIRRPRGIPDCASEFRVPVNFLFDAILAVRPFTDGVDRSLFGDVMSRKLAKCVSYCMFLP